MGGYTVYGTPIASLSQHELQRSIERSLERAQDAMRYGGPAHARMYLDELRDLLNEQRAREGGILARHEPPLW